MKPCSDIRCGWCRRAISFCLARLWKGCTILLCILVALLAASWFGIEWTPDGTDSYPGGIVLRDSAGEIIRVSLGPGDVDCRPYYRADPDDWIVKALVAAEDGTFWEHCGVRPLSIVRAACQNILYRRRVSGASTITMQAVRLVKPHPKSLWWKWKEAVMALKMERAKDKCWIISQYLNRAPYGSNFVGIEAAANGWFGKGAKSLGIGEAAMLAGMVQAPSRFRPDRGYDRAFRRRDYVLGRMLALGMITEEQLEGAKRVRPVLCRAPRPFRHPYYCDWYLRSLEKDRAAGKTSGDYTTPLDADIQLVCENAVDDAAAKGGWSVAAVAMRTATGETVALACSGDYFAADGGQVNTALAPRPAGSTLKPFLVALAMDMGLATPEERLADIPKAYKGYAPANFDSTHRGLVTVRDALVLSLNMPFVQLLQRVGVERFGGKLRETGFAHMDGPDASFGLGMAIGNVEVTLVELAAAYAKLARGGDGAFSPCACHLVSDMLSGGERSPVALGHVADVEVPRFAWKTGTSSAYRDAWTVLWNPEYTVAVWCGRKRGGFGDTTLVGAKAAAPVAWRIARALYPQNAGPWFAEPDGIVRRKVCSLTGLPANGDCPSTEEGRAIAGISATAQCPVHRRDFEGRPVERMDAFLAAFSGLLSKAGKLAIMKPEDGAKIIMPAGGASQKVAFKTAGNPDGAKLWWFLDGTPAGESAGNAPFVAEMPPGRHEIVCSTAEGVTASATVTVSLP